MSNVSKVDFVALKTSGDNYLSWILDAGIHLDANSLGDTIKPGNQAPKNKKARAMIFLRHHLDDGLKKEYVSLRDPADLWNSLRERYDHQKTVILSKARYDWMHLRLQDFKYVREYNSAIHEISQRLKLCGQNITDDDMLEKTYSTFHAMNVVLQQQYREKGFKKYTELISCLLVAEQNNELLMKNHEPRPTGSAPFPEVNAASFNNIGYDPYRGRGRGNGRGLGCGRGRGKGRHVNFKSRNNHHKRANNEAPKNENDGLTKKIYESACYRCDIKGHWSHTCRTTRHLIDLYQASKSRDGNVETNYIQDANNHGQFDMHISILPTILTTLKVELST